MKIAFAMMHQSSGYPYNEVRQLFIASNLIEKGFDARVFCLSSESSATNSETFGYICPTMMCPIDTPVQDVHDATSNVLIETLRDFSPDIIFIKGIDYLQCKIIIESLSARFVAIVGGTSQHKLLEKCDGILYETSKQQKNYPGMVPSNVLPKFISWADASKDTVTKEFDIVNVGNFDEERKAQELLLQLSFYKSIVFVGGGSRLEHFRSIFGKPNITFTGHISEAEVYSHINKSSIMVHSSTWDGYPRSVAQSLACGVPVVGLINVLDGINDDLIIRTEIKNLTETSLELLNDQDRLSRLSIASRLFMHQTSSTDNIMEVTLDMITKLTKK